VRDQAAAWGHRASKRRQDSARRAAVSRR
jgi:hypothetical protein